MLWMPQRLDYIDVQQYILTDQDIDHIQKYICRATRATIYRPHIVGIAEIIQLVRVSTTNCTKSTKQY